MKAKFTVVILFLSVFLGSILASSCQKKTADARPKILVSVAPYRYFIERLTGNTCDVVCLVPQGTDPHLYETPPRLVEDALQAKIWFRLGEPGEKKFVSLMNSRASSMRLVNLSEGLDLIHDCSSCCHHHEDQDLHIWVSPRLMLQQVEKMCTELCQAFPEYASLYQEKLQEVKTDLIALDQEIASLFLEHPTPSILMAHPSLGYFCRDYGIEQLSIEIEGKEPRPNSLIQLLDEVKSKNIRKIFTQPQHDTRGAERVASELKIPVEMIDPYADDYLKTLRQIAQAIRY